MRKLLITLLSSIMLLNVLTIAHAESDGGCNIERSDNATVIYYDENGNVLPGNHAGKTRATSYVQYTVLDSGTKTNQFVSYIAPYNIWTSGLDAVFILNNATNYTVSFSIAYGTVTATIGVNNLGGYNSNMGVIKVSGKTFRIYATADIAWEYCKGVEYDAYTNNVIQTFYFTTGVKVGQGYVTETK